MLSQSINRSSMLTVSSRGITSREKAEARICRLLRTFSGSQSLHCVLRHAMTGGGLVNGTIDGAVVRLSCCGGKNADDGWPAPVSPSSVAIVLAVMSFPILWHPE